MRVTNIRKHTNVFSMISEFSNNQKTFQKIQHKQDNNSNP